MDIRQANEIIACLPKSRTLFPYYKDRYAAMILEKITGDGMPIAKLKASRFAKLLHRPAVREVVAAKGDGMLVAEDLMAIQPDDYQHYVLTLGLWGWKSRDRDWQQMSRKGTNLVLQLNFSRDHDRMFRRLMDPADNKPLTWSCHPVCRRGRNTLAWARIDLDLDAGEALIEEVQSDWVRDARHYKEIAECWVNRPADHTIWVGGTLIQAANVIKYADEVLSVHSRIWPEAMLAAALWFLLDEIGVHVIWYHDHRTGARLKHIGGDRPPRSLYADLPKGFCFERTTEAPRFIEATAPRPFKRRFRDGREHFWRLEL